MEPPPRVPCHSASAVLPYCYTCVTLSLLFLHLFPILMTYFFSPPWFRLFLSSLCRWCRPWPTNWTQDCSFSVCCYYSCLSLPTFCRLVFRLVFLWSPHVGPSARRIIGLIVPANSNLVLGTQGACLIRFLFCFSLSFFFPFLFVCVCVFVFPFLFLFFECTNNTMGMFLVLFGCKWYGTVYHSSLVPFPSRSGMILPCALLHTWYQVLDCFLPTRCIFGTACFMTTGFQGSELLRGAILNRTYSSTHKNLCIYLYFLTIFGPVYYGPP